MNTLKRFLKSVLSESAYTKLQLWYARLYHSYYMHYLHKKIDCLVVSYPKSGRTWLRAILGKYFELVYHVPFTTHLHQLRHNTIPIIEFTHTLDWLEKHGKKKVIILLRDPRDVIVSYYHQCTQRYPKVYEDSISSFLRDESFGIDRIVDYYNALKDYMGTHGAVLCVTYEDFHSKPLSVMKQILHFLEMPVDQGALEKALDFSRFSRMQRMEKEGKFDTMRLTAVDSKNINTFKVRRGKVKGYKDELSRDDIKYLDGRISQRLRLDYY